MICLSVRPDHLAEKAQLLDAEKQQTTADFDKKMAQIKVKGSLGRQQVSS